MSQKIKLSQFKHPHECLICGHEKAHKHGKTTKGIQRYKCPHYRQTFPENLNSLYYNL